MRAKAINFPLLIRMLLFLILLGSACKRDRINATDYPDEVAQILATSCVSAGCHTSQSAYGAAGLNLETWENLFQGSRGGSPVIPHSPDNSFLLYSLNTDPSLGPVLIPTMPLGQSPLTDQEYYTLWHWINEGCPNAAGALPFPDDPNRRKYYVGHSECDQVAVFDAASRQVMRMVEVGRVPGSVEYVFDVQVTPDKQDWFVVFFSTSTHIERYSTLTDEKIADILLGDFGWRQIGFSPDGKWAFVTNEFQPIVAVVDLEHNTVLPERITFPNSVQRPVFHPSQAKLYLTEYGGIGLQTLDFNSSTGTWGTPQPIDLVQGRPSAIADSLQPWEIFFLPDGSQYFVSCPPSHEIRVFDATNDSLLEVIALPAGPSRMEWSVATERLFVACMDDQVSWGGAPLKRGSVNVINTATHQLEKTVYAGFQPYGMVVDDEQSVLAVLNRNTDPTGPAPHHESPCGERNGYLTLIDLHTLDLVPDYKPELLVDPINLAIK